MLYIPLLLLCLTGCRQAAIHLKVPQGYAGQIVIDCGSNDNSGTMADSTVEVDAQGHGRVSVCPRDEARIYIDRNGSSTRVEQVKWLRTGDGLTTQFRLDIR